MGERERFDMNAWAKLRCAVLKEQCEGFDDPDERCPRRLKDCVCWKARRAVETQGDLP